MLELDKIIPVDERSFALLAFGGELEGKESGQAGLDSKKRIDLLRQRLGAARNKELAQEIIKGAESAMEKAGDPNAQYSFREALGLEAVVETVDRPSLNIQDGFVNPTVPGYKTFEFKLLTLKDQIRRVIAAVGCIKTPPGNIIGTVFHFAEGYVVTNRHVLEEIATQKPDGSWSLTSPDKTTVDFQGEAGRQSEPGFRVVGVKFCGNDPIKRKVNFAHLDLAVLEIEPIKQQSWPKTITFDGNNGALRKERWIYTIGFPGRPRTWKTSSKPDPGYEVASVIAETFGDNFNCKKFAPGQILHAPGTLPGDKAQWVFAHDCSTLRGNSGSAVVEFAQAGARVLGIHFGGVARSTNWGHAFPALQDKMKALGATYL